jgi:hypothetical protein
LVARHLSTTILLQLATNEEHVVAEAGSAAPAASQPVAMMIRGCVSCLPVSLL